MPQRSNKFQTLIAQIQKNLADDESYRVEESAFLLNSITGEAREVDVLVQATVANVDIMISFECTSQRRRVGSPWVESMLKKHEHLPTNYLFLVSQAGFAAPALKLVDKHERVEAITLKEAIGLDWAAHLGELSGLRFCGYEFEPNEIRVHWQRQAGVDDSNLLIDASTRFIKLETGDELDPLAFALDVLRSDEASREVSKRYLADEQVVASRTKREGKALRSEGQVEFTWRPQPETWVIRTGSGQERSLSAVQVKAAMAIKDSPIELSLGSFRNTNVAHATIEKPFVNKNKNQGDEMVLVLTETKDGNSTASASYSDPKFKHKEIRFKNLGRN